MMMAVYTGIPHQDETPVTIEVASAMPPRSAPMLMMLATISTRHALHNTQRG